MTDRAQPLRHEVELEVRYAETDQMGVVHHANYLVWFELARTALCAQTEYPYSRIETELDVWLMVSGVHASYRGGARYGDRIAISAWIQQLRSRTVHFGYAVRRDSDVLVEGVTEHVWVDRGTKKPRRMPPVLEPVFRRLAGLGG